MKELFFGNLPTKAMAVLLAFVTWAYLYAQGTDQKKIKVSFEPIMEIPGLVSGRFSIEGQTLKPKELIEVTVSGPKGDLVALQSGTWRYRPRVDPADLDELGKLPVPLERDAFDLPPILNVVGVPKISLDYVMYVEREIELHVNPDASWVGTPGFGFRVERVTPVPSKIRARIPADKPNIKEVYILPVPVDGRVDKTFSIKDWKLDKAATEARIEPVKTFRVDVQLTQDVSSKRLPVDLHISALPGLAARIELVDTQITIGLAGPENILQEAGPSAFHAFVAVTKADLEAKGPNNLRNIFCVILEPRYRGKITVEIMPDTAPENREVKVRVLPVLPPK